MKLQTERFGTLEIDSQDILEFPEGILGFEEYHRYTIIEQSDSIFHFLQCIDEPQLAFVVLMPELLRPDYQVVLDEPHISQLKISNPEEARVYSIVTIPEDVAEMTANLQAPVIVNTKERLGKQVILMDGKYHTKHNVLAEMQKVAYQQHKKESGEKNQVDTGEKGKDGESKEQLRKSV